MLVTVASPTTTQEVLSTVVDMSSPTGVVASILIEIVVVTGTLATGTPSIPTGTNTPPASQAASTSGRVSSNGLPPLPPLLQWFQWAVVTIFAVAGCIYLVRRKTTRSRQEYCCHADVPGVFDGGGRTCGSKDSWLLERLRNFMAMLPCRERSPRCQQTILPLET